MRDSIATPISTKGIGDIDNKCLIPLGAFSSIRESPLHIFIYLLIRRYLDAKGVNTIRSLINVTLHLPTYRRYLTHVAIFNVTSSRHESMSHHIYLRIVDTSIVFRLQCHIVTISLMSEVTLSRSSRFIYVLLDT